MATVNKKTVLLTIAMLFISAGCASLRETGRGILGTSTQILEASRGNAVKQTVEGDYTTAYARVLAELKKSGCYVYRQDNKGRLIAFYLSGDDTTACGVFFAEAGSHLTGIEIVSPSSYARDAAASRLKVLAPPLKQEAPAAIDNDSVPVKPVLRGIPIDGTKQSE